MRIPELVRECCIGLILSGLSSWCQAQTPAVSEDAESSSASLRQIAYIKASNAGAGDQFGVGGALLGDAVALSDDGSTLAVGAPFEGSGATGIDGNQNDDSTYGAGAVYVFTRELDSWMQQA